MEYKLFYARANNNKNGIGLIMNKNLKKEVTEVERIMDRMSRIDGWH